MKLSVPVLDWKLVTIVALVSFIVGVGLTAYLGHNYYEKKLAAVNTELTDYKSKYGATAQEKEKALIDKAIAEKKANTPLKEYVKGDTVTEIQYVEKTSSRDADLQMTTGSTVVASFNGQEMVLPAEDKKGMKLVDGKWVIDQQSKVTLDIDSIVNRQIANTILEKDHEIEVLKRQKTQQTFWGTVIGAGIGVLASK